MIKLSVIIVAYGEFESVDRCLKALPQAPWLEIIVINNTFENRGFGAGCNLGSQLAQGEVLLFLNPDTIAPTQLESLADTVSNESAIGLWGFRLTDEMGRGTASVSQQPSWWSAPLLYSGIAKRFSRWSVVKKLWFGWKVPKARVDVGVVSGAVMAVKKEFFNDLGGFDPRYFLYWEEVDLARRVLEQGKRVVFDPSWSFVHSGGLSSKGVVGVADWYKQSRFAFFSKWFGRFYGFLLEGWLTMMAEWRLLILLIVLWSLGWMAIQFNLWLHPIQAWWWFELQPLSHLLKVYPRLLLGLSGVLAGVVVCWNELSKQTAHKRWLSCLLIGLWGLWLFPTAGLISLGLTCVWIGLDVIVPQPFLRKVVAVGLVGCWLGLGIIGWRGVSMDTETIEVDWNQVMEYVLTKHKDVPVRLSCRDCTQDHSLDLGRLWLLRYGLNQPTEKFGLSDSLLQIMVSSQSKMTEFRGVEIGGADIIFSRFSL